MRLINVYAYCYICDEYFEDEQNRKHIEFTGRCIVCDIWLQDITLEYEKEAYGKEN